MSSKISVIIPVYNVESYLARCLESVVQQTYQNIEIILINDGSTDGSGQLCQQFAKLYPDKIRVIHQENQGLSGARNTGIGVTTGELVTFVDSDDWLALNALEILYNNLISYQADISIAQMVRCSEQVNEKERPSFFSQKEMVEVFSQATYIKNFMKIDRQETEYYAWNKLYRRELLDDEGHYPIGLTAEDVVGTYKALLKAQKIVKSNQVTYYYYQNPNSITASFSQQKAKDLLTVWDINCSLSEHNQQYLSWARFNRIRVEFAILMQLAKAGGYKEKSTKPLITELVNNLRQNRSYLLNSKMSFARKAAIILFTLNYDLAATFIYMSQKLPKRR